jgi:hypothetical protein
VALSTITLAFTTVLFIKRDNAIDKPNFWKDFSIEEEQTTQWPKEKSTKGQTTIYKTYI